MSDLNILHLSDIHFPGKSPADISIVVESLLTRLQELESERQPHLVIFSGDLVLAGNDLTQFTAAKSEFLHKVLASCKLSDERLFICAGNHDIDRQVVRRLQYIESGLLSTLHDRVSINAFIDDHWDVIASPPPPPFARLTNYYKAIWENQSTSCVFSNLFLQAYVVTISGRRIGVACFNTAWRTTGEPGNVDRGNLILGERVVDHAAKILGGCEIRLGVFHHPLDWLHPADEAAVDARLQSEFDILFCGHIHKSQPIYRASTHGNAILSQAGCLYHSRDYFNGFNLVSLQLADAKATVSIEEYSDERRTFVPASRIVNDGNITYPLLDIATRKGQILPSLIRRTKPMIRKLASDHISIDKTDPVVLDIETHFVCPPLREQSQGSVFASETETSEKDGHTELHKILLDSKSFVLIGRSESGKTTLAHYIAVKVSDGMSDCPRLPLLTRFSELRKGDSPLWRLTREYAAEIGDAQINKQIVEKEQLFVIVDDVDLFDASRLEILKSCISSHSNIRWCLLIRNPAGSMSNESAAEAEFAGFTILSVSELQRSAIRTLSANFLKSDRNGTDTDEVFRALMEQIQRTGLPRSGYIVSLMIWAMKNKSQGEILNEAVLLENLIDYVLGRMDYTGALRKEFDFQSKTTVLQSLAYHFKTTVDVQSKNDATQFIIEFLSQKGLKYDATEILNGFINCGILYEIGSTVSFRYRRFQEFFVAGFLRDNSDVLKSIQDEGKWLQFSRELDLFTARFRHESSFLDYAKGILDGMEVPEPEMTHEDADRYLSEGHNSDFTIKQLDNMRKQPMTSEKIDSLLDKTERRMNQKRENEIVISSSSGDQTRSETKLQFYIALEMYSEFIRNLEFADKDQKRLHLKSCLTYWELALRGWLSVLKEAISNIRDDLSTIDDGKSTEKTTAPNTKKRVTKPEDWKKLIGFVESIVKYALPSMLSQAAYQNLGSEKLIDFIDEIIGDDESDNLRKLFCSFILLELSPARAIERISKMIEIDSDRWFLTVITQRLYAYYASRPLPKGLNTKFEALVAEIELQLSGSPERKNKKGLFLTEIKKRAFREKPTTKKS